MPEEEKLRFIREEPWIARTLRKFRPLRVVPKEIHDWLFDWAEDVGRVMRSREMMVSFVASMGYYAIAVGLISLLESIGLVPKVVERVKRIVGRG